MAAPRDEATPRAVQAPRPDGRAASARAAAGKAGDDAAEGAPRPEETGNGDRRGRGAGRAKPEPEARRAALRGLFRGLRAGDLETVLLTVAMAADENRMPSADPAEERRILAFLARLAGHDAALPPPPGGSGTAPEGPPDRTGAEDGPPAAR